MLPALDDGLTLLDIEGGRGVPIVQALVLDHLLLRDGPAGWLDAHGYATTTSLARLTPSQRLLDRIHVARGFTAYQHYGALCDLPVVIDQATENATTVAARSPAREPQDHHPASPRPTPSLIVAPALDAHYRADNTLKEAHARTLQARALAKLTGYAEGYGVPVLMTRTASDTFTEPIATAADHHLECEQTRLGPRFVGDEVETLVYPLDDGATYQTTIAYWRQVLRARADQVGHQPATPPQPPGIDDAPGTGVMADGTTATLRSDPLLDTWTGFAGPGGP